MPSLLTFHSHLLTPLCLCVFVPLCYAFSSPLRAFAPSHLREASSKEDCVEYFFLCLSVPLFLCVTLFAFYLRGLRVSVVQFLHFQRQRPLFPPCQRQLGRRRYTPAFPPILANAAPRSLLLAVENSACSASLPCSRNSHRRQFRHFRLYPKTKILSTITVERTRIDNR
jgi:hypothetical protein